jgi:Rod binding domain-containing protein
MSVDPITGPIVGSSTANAPDEATQKAASGFEELLVRQLAQVLVDSTQQDGDGEADATGATGGTGSDATTSLLQSFLPDALSQSVTAAGGLGLASSLAPALQEDAR